jgi:hypothetical protein
MTANNGPMPSQIDPGIRRAVEILQISGLETFESCEGGPGHAFPNQLSGFTGRRRRDGVPWRSA